MIPGAARAADQLGHHLALRHGPMRQHGFSGHIADGINAAHRCAALGIDADEWPLPVKSQFGQPRRLAARTPPDGDQHLFGRDLFGAVVTRNAQRALGRQPACANAGADPHAQLGQARHDRAGQLGVILRENTVRRLDHGDPRAQLGEGGAQLQADVAAADHGHGFGQLFQCERVCR